MGLGDLIEEALVRVGINSELVEKWIGFPCGCEERKQKLNSLGYLATRILNGKVEAAAEYLRAIMQ